MRSRLVAGLALLAAAAGAVIAQVPTEGPDEAAKAKEVAEAPAVPETAVLDKKDVDAWLDGLMPASLERGDIAGAVVLVVKDGQILTQKGYGYADVEAKKKMDPATTLFRPGSMSKLFTWTSVMQLVEQGKIDLDADVNQYLDFKIPPYEGKPMTMRQIMSHVAGFEEASGGLMVDSADEVPPLGEKLKSWIPKRIFAPGTTPAYSNYATGLAGYVVQRVSGESFEDYTENHIFKPLGMSQTTFRQPLPANLQPHMSKGYMRGSGKPVPFEFVTLPPAGSATTSAPDVAKFMISHLNNAQGLLRPETARMMHNSPFQVFPEAASMSLGWIEVRNHSRPIISHGGDTLLFHTGMALIPSENVGLVVNVNSTGQQGAGSLRGILLSEFMKRYFTKDPAPAAPTNREQALADARKIEGTYIASRRTDSGLRKAGHFFSQSQVETDEDGAILSDDGREKWVHIGPLLWRNDKSNEIMSAKEEGGKVTMFARGFPASAQMRVGWYENISWFRPALIASLIVLLLAAIAWPLGAVQRRYYGANLPQIAKRTRDVQRSTAGLAAATLVLIGIWLSVIMSLRVGLLSGSIYLLQIATIVVIPGLFLFALWRLWLAIQSRQRVSIAWSLAIALAAFIVLWGALVFHLIFIGLSQ
ncbi:serine hydrolase domain-containing protein [Sphingosinicella rhizophila]|uniref:Serine hydrolase domain-containing protein n=1 Tax=Sphingosinicella rhizophila TaxID=3050082 RepID=A0ABU3QA63_9SPHN|nr:serine hydrolase domain-containing protein [Sphingosinicella sp. GR2756]MDT9600294.1 serine hydrolase domain-containing protein [Sphingosinicella sp. GR2756]